MELNMRDKCKVCGKQFEPEEKRWDSFQILACKVYAGFEMCEDCSDSITGLLTKFAQGKNRGC